MKLFIGCDEAGTNYKNEIIEMLRFSGHDVIDVIPKEEAKDYPDIAKEVCTKVLENESSKGILICGTGMGMCVSSNKIRGIRATLCNDVYSAQKSRSSINANILTFGALTLGVELAKTIVMTWVQDYTVNPKSAIKVAKLMMLENM